MSDRRSVMSPPPEFARERLSDVMPTLWFEARGLMPEGYYVCAMTSLTYDGPIDSKGCYELEIFCSRGLHGIVREMYDSVEDKFNLSILSYPSQMFFECNKNPRALLLRFQTSEKRDEFARWWYAEGDGQA